MGGVWERQIRTIRKVLQALLDKFKGELTDEILETLFCEVESIVNSRPLTKYDSEVRDDSVLSPNQLLMFSEGPVCFDKIISKSQICNKRYRFIQYLADQFWKRWTKLYLPELQKRSKWQEKQRSVEVGDIVLLCEENTPRYLWPLARVVEVKLGRDKLVRTVKVKTKTTTLIRPISKIVMLEC